MESSSHPFLVFEVVEGNMFRKRFFLDGLGEENPGFQEFRRVSPATLTFNPYMFPPSFPQLLRALMGTHGNRQEQQVGQVLRLLEILIWKDSELQDLLQREGDGSESAGNLGESGENRMAKIIEHQCDP